MGFDYTTSTTTEALTHFLSRFGMDREEAVKRIDSKYGNGDNILVLSEFRTCMNRLGLGDVKDENGNDLVEAFWKKMDTKQPLSKIGESKYTNKNAVTSDEINSDYVQRGQSQVEVDNLIEAIKNLCSGISDEEATDIAYWLLDNDKGIEDIEEAIKALGRHDVLRFSISNLPTSMLTESSKTGNINSLVRNKYGNVITPEYQLSGHNPEEVFLNGKNEIIVKSGKEEGTISFSLNLIVDGEIKSTITKSIKVVKKAAPTGGDEIPPAGEYKDISESSVNYTNFTKKRAERADNASSMYVTRNAAIKMISDLVDGFRDTLLKEGYDSTLVAMAVKSTISYYTSAISAISDKSKSGEQNYIDYSDTFSYQYYDKDGKLVTSNNTTISYIHCSDRDWSLTSDKILDALLSSAKDSVSGIYLLESILDFEHNDFSIAYDESAIWKKFCEFYSMITEFSDDTKQDNGGEKNKTLSVNNIPDAGNYTSTSSFTEVKNITNFKKAYTTSKRIVLLQGTFNPVEEAVRSKLNGLLSDVTTILGLIPDANISALSKASKKTNNYLINDILRNDISRAQYDIDQTEGGSNFCIYINFADLVDALLKYYEQEID